MSSSMGSTTNSCATGNTPETVPRAKSADSRDANPLFLNLMRRSVNTEVDVTHCVPMFLNRGVTRGNITRLNQLFLGKGKGTGPAEYGIVAGTDNAIVLQLGSETSYFVTDYLKNSGMSSLEASRRFEEVDIWYGVIDGNHSLLALKSIIEEKTPGWGNFQWYVTKLTGGHIIDEYRKLARMQNARHDRAYYVETTHYDLLKGLRLEYENILSKKLKVATNRRKPPKVGHREVATAYDGAPHTGHTSVKQAVSVAVRLSARALDVYGSIVNQELPGTIFNNPSFQTSGLSCEQDVLQSMDCRLFRKMVCFGALRSSRKFMSAVQDGNEMAQINTFFRMKHWCEGHNFRSIQTETVTEQFHLALDALKEEEKFLTFICEEDWPEGMETIRVNLHNTTLCDSELITNRGNDSDILPSIWNCFKRLYFQRAQALLNGSKDITVTSDPPEHETVQPPTQDDIEAAALLEAKKEAERKAKLRSDSDDILQAAHIYSFNMTWEAFEVEHWKEGSVRFDFLISDLCDIDITSENAVRFSSFCNRVIKRGSYIFLFVDPDTFPKWKSYFKNEGFKVMRVPFVVLYNRENIQRRVLRDFPQSHIEFGLVAKSSGVHPDGFKPKFEDGSVPIEARYASAIDAMPCIEKLKLPNSRSPLYIHEKSKELIIHLLDILSPLQCHVLEPSANTMATSLAFLDSKRGCTNIEK